MKILKCGFLSISIIFIKHNAYSQLSTFYPYGRNEMPISKLVVQDTGSMLKKNSSSLFEKTTTENKTIRQFYAPLKRMIVTSPYGWRRHPVTGEWKHHNGIDLKAYYEPVYAMADGVVEFAGWGNAEGNYIIINHGDMKTIYCHLDRLHVVAGDIVKGGHVIGISGNTGRSTGPHLHLSVKCDFFGNRTLKKVLVE